MMVDSRIQGAAPLLRERPGEWAVVAEWDLPSNLSESVGVWAVAVNTAAQIRSGRGDVFQPPGAFEAGAARAGEEKVCLYVRFVSEPTVPVGVLGRWDVPFAELGDLMGSASGLLGSRIPRPLPVVLVEECVAVHQDSAFGVYLIDPDENIMEMGWVSGVSQVRQIVQWANASLEGNLPYAFLATHEVRACVESFG